MKKLFLLLIVFSFTVIAQQDNKNQPEVELPKFVIIGSQKVKLNEIRKLPPSNLSIVSDNIIRPFITTEFDVSDIDLGGVPPVKLYDSVNIIRNNFDFSLGMNYIPKTNYNLQIPFKSGFMQGNFYGENVRPYIENANSYKVGGELKFALFSNSESKFLPSVNYNFRAGFDSYDYKFYGSKLNPLRKRNLNTGFGEIDIKNFSEQKVYFGLKASDKFFSIKNDNFSENLLAIDPFVRYQLPNFSIGMNADFKNLVHSDSTISKYNISYLMLSPMINLIFGNVKVNFGINYSVNNESNYFALYASAAIKIDENLTMFADYNPKTEFLTVSDLITKNRYLNLNSFRSLVVQKPSALSLFIKYEYEELFQFNGGFRFEKIDNIPYFELDNFDTYSVKAESGKNYQFELNLNLYPSKFGTLYGTAIVSDVRNSIGYKIPYYSDFSVLIGYEYNFDRYAAGTTLNYKWNTWLDSLNTKKLPDYFNLGLYGKYNFTENVNLNLKVDNLINRKNFFIENYRDFPLDIEAGISFRW